MRSKRLITKIVSCLMAVLITVNTCGIYAFAEEIGGKTGNKFLTIKSEEEFVEFAKACVNDEYSMHLIVSLKQDLDMTGYDVRPVPVFNGTFNGNGHKITGFYYDDIGTNEGLFRYLSETGIIKNLNIEITMTPEGNEKNIGGLCGENRGIIEKCNVMGYIEGLENTGGVAGVNEASGKIIDCSNGAEVNGEKNTGGIAGYNYGNIINSNNIGPINTKPCDTAEGMGGIAGYSEGNIENCVNRGVIGYKRTGYNSGGIAGVQSGDIYECTNEGEVYAKRNAGGIAGQNLPSSTTEYSNKLDEIGDILDSMPDDFKAVNSEIDNMADTITDIMNEIDDTISSISDIVSTNGEKISNDLDTVSENVRDNVRDITDSLDAVSIEADLTVDGIERVTQSLAAAGEAAGKIPFNEMIESIGNASVVSANSVKVIMQSISGYGTANSESITKLMQLIVLYFQYNSAGDAENAALVLAQIGAVAGNLSGSSESMKNDINTAAAQLVQAMMQMNDSIKKVNEASDKFKESLTILNAQVGRLNESYKAFDAITDDLNSVAWELDDAMDKIDVFIDSATDDLNEIFDITDNRIQSMDDNLEIMYDNVDNSTNRMTDYLDGIVDKMDAAGDLLSELLDGPEDITNDISESAERGLGSAIIGCINSGTVNSDYNAGGIVGIASKDDTRNIEEISGKLTDIVNGDFEYEDIITDADDEDEDILTIITNNLIADAFTVYRMHISSCKNTGDVTVKNDYAGGIAGYGLEGVILECSNLGLVTTDGEYCGGIMGYSEGIIKKCNSAGALVSSGKAGGIVGYGMDIYDCNAMVSIDSDSNTIGAIAYYADGEIVNNRFVSDVLSGVDGINRSGQAINVAYDELKDIFDTMIVTFIGEDGQIIARMKVKYGDSIETLPVVLNRDKEYWIWDEFDSSRIVTNMVINGKYENRLSTIQVSSDEKQPAFLAEGDFYPDQKLKIAENPDIYGIFGDKAVYYAGTAIVTGHDGDDYTGLITVRMKTSNKGDVYVLNNGVYEKADSKRDGSYVVFKLENGASFAYVESPVSLLLIVAAAAAVILIVVLIVTAAVVKRKKSKAIISMDRSNEHSKEGKK